MTDYCKTLFQLCGEAGITIVQAFHDATPYLSETLMADKIVNKDYIPDLTTTSKLAQYFHVGVETFLPTAGLKPKDHKTYIAGPVTAIPNARETFEQAYAYLASKGRQVFSISRVTSVLPEQFMTRKNFMDLGIALLSMCDEIAMLPNWKTHRGCEMEYSYARAIGLDVTELTPGQLLEGAKIINKKAR